MYYIIWLFQTSFLDHQFILSLSKNAFYFTLKALSVLLNSKWKNYCDGLDILKVLSWLMSQYGKTIVEEFFFKAHSPLLEMILFWKWTSSQLLIFSEHLFCKNMHLWAHFRNTINQLHVNGTWFILAVISFMAVISWIATSGIIHASQKVSEYDKPAFLELD